MIWRPGHIARITGFPVFSPGDAAPTFGRMETLPVKATLLLVDDQSIILDGVEALLAATPDIEVVGRCNDGAQAVQMAATLLPDLVLMDVNMPGMDGIEATRKLLKVTPECRVVMLSMYGHREFILEVMDAGAWGYLLKNTGKEDLLVALRSVASGRRYLPENLRKLVEQGDRNKDRTGANGYGILTKRELQVVKLILREHTTAEIATMLFISPETVETHRRNIMHKLDVRNTAGLVKYAVERGWGGQ